MAKVTYTGPAGQPCDELYEFNQEAENPKVPVPGTAYEIPKDRVAPFVMNAHFEATDAEAKEVYADLVGRGLIVNPEVAAEVVEEVPQVDASSSARDLALSLAIDLESEVASGRLEGTGQNGRVLAVDVEKYAEANGIEKPPENPPAQDPATGESRAPGSGEGGEV